MELQPAQPFTHTPVHPAQGEGKTINKVIIGISHNVLSHLALSLLKAMRTALHRVELEVVPARLGNE